MDTPYGPIKIPGNRQIAIPKDAAAKVELSVKDEVYLVVREGTRIIEIVPADLLKEWLMRGRASETPPP